MNEYPKNFEPDDFKHLIFTLRKGHLIIGRFLMKTSTKNGRVKIQRIMEIRRSFLTL